MTKIDMMKILLTDCLRGGAENIKQVVSGVPYGPAAVYNPWKFVTSPEYNKLSDYKKLGVIVGGISILSALNTVASCFVSPTVPTLLYVAWTLRCFHTDGEALLYETSKKEEVI